MFEMIDQLNSKLRSKTINGVVGFFEDENQLLKAAEQTREAGYRKFDTISPFPIHGMDDAIGLDRSIVPWFTFIAGTIGCAFGVWFQWWTSAVNWPVNVGGKAMFSLPAFVPVIFEITILFAALVSVAGMLWLCGLPKVDPPVIDPDLTSHKFALFIPENDNGFNEQSAMEHLKKINASDVRKTEF